MPEEKERKDNKPNKKIVRNQNGKSRISWNR